MFKATVVGEDPNKILYKLFVPFTWQELLHIHKDLAFTTSISTSRMKVDVPPWICVIHSFKPSVRTRLSIVGWHHVISNPRWHKCLRRIWLNLLVLDKGKIMQNGPRPYSHTAKGREPYFYISCHTCVALALRRSSLHLHIEGMLRRWCKLSSNVSLTILELRRRNS